MLVVAPIIFRHLGTEQYGVWAVSASVSNIGSILASGFGDANTQRLAAERGAARGADVARVVKAAMGIHLVLGLVAGWAIWCSATFLAERLAPHDQELKSTCVWCIRIAAALTLVRALETVCVSTQRAYERYGAAVRISIAGRLVSLAVTAMLTAHGLNVTTTMAATAVVMAAALALQILALIRLVGTPVVPSFDRSISADLLQFGALTWIVSAAGVVFSQVDRVLGGASLGVAGIVAYALCAQVAQPVYGLTAAGLHFLFPYIASRQASSSGTALTRTLLLACTANTAFVLAGASALLFASDWLLHLISTATLAAAARPLLPWVLAGPALMALSVTGTYFLLALGRAGTVAALQIAASIALVLVTGGWLQSRGVRAIAEGRIAFALIAMCVYVPLLRELRGSAAGLRQNVPGAMVEEA
ncbi:lipopolysaccharide biosynthesis protein [Occallatibacter savannae]|uniref:lipopolysaccharide biosynthesis protein n=1 Tax=Occallatibacter savannae TaxID=1002691 RepID=UPI0023B7F41C|nr:MATE family efflux transporter [Occallatibacter savannae]